MLSWRDFKRQVLSKSIGSRRPNMLRKLQKTQHALLLAKTNWPWRCVQEGWRLCKEKLAGQALVLAFA
jgi:hypothetical protein